MTFGFVRRRRESRDATGTTGLAGAAVDCAGAGCTAESKQDESTRSGGLQVLRRALFVFVILAPGLRRAADFAPRRWAVLRSARQLLLGPVIRPRAIERGRHACLSGRIVCVGPTVRIEDFVDIARPSLLLNYTQSGHPQRLLWRVRDCRGSSEGS
jgi:hypothetical protein